MHRVRLFVLWIMMFAVPFQGYAAAGMVFCGPGHVGAMSSVSAERSVTHDAAQHPHADGHPDHHHEAAQPAKPSAKDSVAVPNMWT